VRVVDLGADVPYARGMAVMHSAIERVDVDGPVLLLLEHTPVLTITRRGGTQALLSSREACTRDGIEVIETDRGGDVTFHGPGQLVGYPILRLGPSSLGSDVVGYVHELEALLVNACRALGVGDAHAKPDRDEIGNHLTGVWCNTPMAPGIRSGAHVEGKLCAIGVGLASGVTRHGFALNIDIAYERFTRHAVPCGLIGRGPTSLARVLASTPTRAAVVNEIRTALTPLMRRHTRSPSP
jgi:lipoate-protein ligase B